MGQSRRYHALRWFRSEQSYRRSHSSVISGNTFRWSRGSPPVISTSEQSSVRTRSNDLRQSHFNARVKSVSRITIGAPQITEGQPDKDAGQPRPGALPLDRAIDLVDSERCWFVLHGRRSSRRRSPSSSSQVRGFARSPFGVPIGHCMHFPKESTNRTKGSQSVLPALLMASETRRCRISALSPPRPFIAFSAPEANAKSIQ